MSDDYEYELPTEEDDALEDFDDKAAMEAIIEKGQPKPDSAKSDEPIFRYDKVPGSKHDEPLKGILYARFSPRPKEKDEIKKQVKDMQQWCYANNVAPVFVAFDCHLSGSLDLLDRPGLKRAIEMLDKGDVLVVRNLNRLARSVLVALLIEEAIAKKGALIASVENGGIMRNDPHSRFLRMVLYGASELQRLEGNERIRRNYSRGVYVELRKLSSTPPFGYKIVEKAKTDRKTGRPYIDKRLEPDPQEMRMLDAFIRLRETGLGMTRLARELNALGYRQRSGKPWDKQSCKTVLRSLRVREAALGHKFEPTHKHPGKVGYDTGEQEPKEDATFEF